MRYASSAAVSNSKILKPKKIDVLVESVEQFKWLEPVDFLTAFKFSLDERSDEQQ